MCRTRISKLCALVAISFMGLQGCQSTQVAGNEAGSEPVNRVEGFEYKKAIVRCHKTGGSRVVKITGKLRCF